MKTEYIPIEDTIEVLKRIRACLTYEDWTTARDYIDIEIEYIQKNRKITNADNIKIEPITLIKKWVLYYCKYRM